MDGIFTPAHRANGHSGSPSSNPVPLLVGRAREQAVLRDQLTTAIGGRGRLVLLGGDAGIGKTSLARDLTLAANDLGCRVLAGHCYDLTNTPPYGPWLDLFEGCRRDPGLPAPPSALAGGRLAPVTDQAALFADVRRFLAELTDAGPAFVLLEDLHWADPASVELLRYVGPFLRHWPILLLITYRFDELTPGHSFAQQLPALVREADGYRLDLHRLDPGALRALVASRYRLTRPEEVRLVAYLERHAEGNPFFATELLRTLEEEALLRRNEEGWSLAALDRVVVPALLRQVLDGRIARLGESTRHPLGIAAVIGHEVPLDLWAKTAGLDYEALFAIVERASEAHLLEASRDGIRVRFVHALTREALYEGVLPPRRRIMHLRVAEELLKQADSDPDAVAYHLQEGGDPRAWEWLVKAGERAQRAYAWLTAVERFQTAANLLAHVPDSAEMRGRLLFRLATLARFSDPASAIPACVEAERLAAQTGDAVLAANAHFVRGILLFYSNLSGEALVAIDEALASLEAMALDVEQSLAAMQAWYASSFAGTFSPASLDDELAATRLRAAGIEARRGNAVWFGALVGHPRVAVEEAEHFLAVLSPGPGVTAGIRFAADFAEHGLGIAYAALGRPDDARRASAGARVSYRDLGHHVLIAFSRLNELWDVVYPFGPLEPATRRQYAAEAEAALAQGGGALAPGISPRLAWLSCFLLDGRWTDALEILHGMPTPGNAYLRREVIGPHATLARHRGAPETAWARIRPLFPEGPASEPGDLIHQEGLFLQRLAADLCLDGGELPGGRAWLEAHDRWLAWSGSVLGRADGRLGWARWHHAAGDLVLARAAAAEALTLAEDPRQHLVKLGAHRLLGELDLASGDHAAAESNLYAARAIAIDGAIPFELALTLLSLAQLRLAMGMIDEAVTFLSEARQICTSLGATPTLARIDAVAAPLAMKPSAERHPAGLTQREVEVLRLLSQRLSNPEIAAALFVSPRTVQTHVEHIFAKLGVTNRREAAEMAPRLGLV